MSKLAKNASILMVFTLLAKILGFVREQVLSFAYGVSMYTDVYITTMNIPSVIFSTLGVALLTTYIPMYIDISENSSEDRAIKFSNNIFTIITCICIGIAILGGIFTEPLVKLFAIGFEGEKLKLAVEFTRILIVGIIFIGLSNLLTAYLQVKNNFVIPGIVTLPQNIVVVASILLSLKYGVHIMAWGSLLGIASQFLIQIPFAKKLGYKYKPIIDIKDKYLKKLIILVLPVFIGVGVNQINTMVDRTLASTLIDGSISALNYANRLNEFVMAMFITSIVTVIYPKLSRLSNQNDKTEFLNIVKSSINTIIILVLPISVGAIALSNPIVSILFERGAFNENATNMTSIALIMYSIGMLASGLRNVLSKIFYSMQDTKTPMINGIITVVINIVLNIALINFMGHAGLALATSLSSIVCIVMLIIKLKNKIKKLDIANIINVLFKVLFASFVMGIITYATYNYIVKLCLVGLVGKLIGVIVATLIGIIVYFIIILKLRINEVDDLKITIIEKINNIRNKR